MPPPPPPLETKERGANCQWNLFGNFQTPPEESDEQLRESILSLNTLRTAALEQLKKPMPEPKKNRSRKKNGNANAAKNQPIPLTNRVQDHKPSTSAGWRPYHVAGKPILSPKQLEGLTGEMKILHDTVLHTKRALLKPCYMNEETLSDP